MSTIYDDRRKKLAECIGGKAAVLLYSGESVHFGADGYYPFEANRMFYYLTGIRQENSGLLLVIKEGQMQEYLFLEEPKPEVERWVGKKLPFAEAMVLSGIKEIGDITALPEKLHRLFAEEGFEILYMDAYRCRPSDLPDYNLAKAKQLLQKYPYVRLKDVSPILSTLRMVKDEQEIARTRKAVELTGAGLERVLSVLKPGMYEYQVQAEFEYAIRYEGAEHTAFETIAGSGANGTMLHYETNQCVCEPDTLILLDLGARYQGYNGDITRTYPVSGRFTSRQKEIYDIVLAANLAVQDAARPGTTRKELNDVCKKVLAKGMIRLGMIQKEEEIGRYYMHSVSHHLGLDVHDVTGPEEEVLQPGMILTDEPGLYIDEEGIGIRIEDDLLITEDGCECLSEDILRTTEEIEAFMRENRA